MPSEKPVTPVIQVHSKEPVIAAYSTKNVREEQKDENHYSKLKVEEPRKQLITQPFSYQKIQERIDIPKAEIKNPINEPSKIIQKTPEKTPEKKNTVISTVEEKTIAYQEIVKDNKGTFSCPKCKKQFSQPIFMANYTDSKQPKLVAHCPYCDQTFDIKQNDSEEELLKKYF